MKRSLVAKIVTGLNVVLLCACTWLLLQKDWAWIRFDTSEIMSPMIKLVGVLFMTAHIVFSGYFFFSKSSPMKINRIIHASMPEKAAQLDRNLDWIAIGLGIVSFLLIGLDFFKKISQTYTRHGIGIILVILGLLALFQISLSVRSLPKTKQFKAVNRTGFLMVAWFFGLMILFYMHVLLKMPRGIGYFYMIGTMIYYEYISMLGTSVLAQLVKDYEKKS